MSTFSLETIRIGPKNQLAGSDSLYDAFNKIQNNFSVLANASANAGISDGLGIRLEANSVTGTTQIINTGVIRVSPGNNISLSSSNANVTITAHTNVAISSNTLSITNTSNSQTVGYNLNLSPSGVIAGSYTRANITVDQYGRITSIANGGSISNISNGSSSVAIPVTNGNVTITAGGIISLTVANNRIVSNVNVAVQGNITANAVTVQGNITADFVTVNDDIMLGNSQIGYNSITTNSMAYYTVAQVPVTGIITGVKFFVKGSDNNGGKYSAQSIVAITDGITANYTIYGNIAVGGSTGELSVVVGAGKMQLKVIPSSANVMSWTAQYQAI